MTSARAWVLALLGALWVAGCAPSTVSDQAGHVQVDQARILGQTAIPVYDYRVLRSYPHDVGSYTEGLVLDGGTMYEGTGLYGFSKLRAYALDSGRVIRETALDARYFGEGVALHDDRIYRLTYLANTGFVYDKASFAELARFRYPTQGWGLTSDGSHLIVSDGSSGIVFLNPETLAVERQIFVTDEVGPVGFLNELEYVDGTLYANVWQTNFIAMIDPGSGRITGWIDLEGLNPDPATLVYPYVLNGIAFDRRSGHLVVTGKHWPALYEIELLPR